MGSEKSELRVSGGGCHDLDLQVPFMVARRSDHRDPAHRVHRFYFQIPARYLAQGCDVPSTALGDDLPRANATAAILYAGYERWKRDRDRVHVDGKAAFGTFDWLVREYLDTDQYKSRSPSTRQCYRSDLKVLSDSVFPGGELEGKRLGDVRLDKLTKQRVGNLADALVVTKEIDFGGSPITVRCGARVRDLVTTACTMWNHMAIKIEMRELEKNPFEGHRIERHRTKNLAATLEETTAFVAAADELGVPAIGTIALTAFEFRWRAQHVVQLFRVEHYRPPDRPDEVLILDSKTMEMVWRPLFDDDGAPLFPTLVGRLDALKGGRVTGHMFARGQVLTDPEAPEATLDMGLLSKRVRKVSAHAGGRRLTLRNFRKGGITEMGEAGLNTQEIMAHTQHTDPRTVQRYLEKTATLQRNTQMTVLEHRGKQERAKARRATCLAGEGAAEAVRATGSTACETPAVTAPTLTWGYGASWNVSLT